MAENQTKAAAPENKPMPSTATTPAPAGNNNAMKIVAGLAVLVVGLLLAQMLLNQQPGNNNNANNTNSPTATAAPTTNPTVVVSDNITAESTATYAFYYPKAFEKITTAQDPVISQYAMPTKDVKNFRDNMNLVRVTSQEKLEINDAYCKSLAESLPKIHATNFGVAETDVKLGEKSYFAQGNVKGCLSVFTIAKNKVNLIMEQKLFHKDGDTNYYIVTIAFEEGSANKAAIEEAMNAFMIK